MTFGAAASRRGRPRRPDDASPCPCGSGEAFGGCCGPALGGEPAATAEGLMRSRYTAFFLGDADHVAATWHPRTRPDTVELDGGLRWTGLRILDVVAGTVDDTSGVVEFRASWTDQVGGGALHERSRFVRQRERCWYVDGDVG